MILRGDEPQWLRQLADRDHPLTLDPEGRIAPGERHDWARDQVADWRARHDPLCQCARTGRG